MENNRWPNVRWFGGSPCSGKSTISSLLAEAYDIDIYHVDDALYQHPERVDPTLHPALAGWMAASCDERWLLPMDELMADAVACYTEHFGMILEDLQEMPSDRIVVVEGTALLPHLVAALGVEPGKALWQAPTPAFQRKHYSRRTWIRPMLAECSDPERAFDNWMERDIQFAQWIAEQAAGFGVEVAWIDGSERVEAGATRVAEHFGLLEQHR